VLTKEKHVSLLKKKLVPNSRTASFFNPMKKNNFFMSVAAVVQLSDNNTWTRCLLIVLCCFPALLFSQPKKEHEKRQEKIELILRYQDLRTVHDGTLKNFLSDRDSVVRERATLAFGSIQDTSVMSLLVQQLTDKSPAVQYAAAFAIGQTGNFLSPLSKERLEHDILWSRLDRMETEQVAEQSPVERMIEELGKFGTPKALSDLLQKYGTGYPLQYPKAMMMSIARFAIRGITSAEAVTYLMRFVKSEEAPPWQVVYALQRIGDHQEIRNEVEYVVQLYKHPNPLARMHLATLLGKIKDERTSLEPLQKLADFDSDWRVRVNALKALANFNLTGKDDIVQTFRREFYNSNTYVALTALSAVGTTALRPNSENNTVQELFHHLRRIAKNENNGFLWQLQAEAALSLAKLEGPPALNTIAISDSYDRPLKMRLLNALGYTGSEQAADILFAYFDSNDKLIARSALEGLHELCNRRKTNKDLIEKTFSGAIAALASNDMALITTAAALLGDSLFLRSSSVLPLLSALERQRIPDDVEPMQEICLTLGKLKDERAIEVLRKTLHVPDRSVALAAASALKAITGKDYSSQLPSFQPLWADFDFKYLRSLPETIRVQVETIRGNFVMQLYKSIAPFSIMSFLKLQEQKGFYRGLTFHRVVPNFVVQGGDPRGDGWGGPGYSLRSEFSPLAYETGMVGIASAGKDTEGSQFFITQSPQPHLDGRYTIIGKVVSGMEVVNKIQVDDHIYDVKVIH
jgi:cyclophilin family peptidyl-prolyl cis-trans isomerase/HEAT repeat protein